MASTWTASNRPGAPGSACPRASCRPRPRPTAPPPCPPTRPSPARSACPPRPACAPPATAAHEASSGLSVCGVGLMPLALLGIFSWRSKSHGDPLTMTILQLDAHCCGCARPERLPALSRGSSAGGNQTWQRGRRGPTRTPSSYPAASRARSIPPRPSPVPMTPWVTSSAAWSCSTRTCKYSLNWPPVGRSVRWLAVHILSHA